jgi:hypothetical protein
MLGKDKDKGKGHPRTGHKGPHREQRYGCTLYLTSVLDGLSGCHTPTTLPPGLT